MLSFFFSRLMGLPHTRLRERGWGVPTWTRGWTRWFSRYMYFVVQPVLKICQIHFAKKSAKLKRMCGRFLMCFPAIDRYRENTCEIFKMIYTIAGEHIPGSIKLNNVYAHYRLDSGQTSPAIFRHLKCVNQNLFQARLRGKTSPAIESIAGIYTTVSNC
jgi:hypothetical protein